MKKFGIAKIASLIFVCVMLFALLALGVSAEEANEGIIPEDVFAFKGYSVDEDGNACFGFTLNQEAKARYEEQIGKTVDIGLVIAFYEEGKAPLDAQGNPTGKAFKVSLNDYASTSYGFKFMNFSSDNASRKYVVAPYVCDGSNVYYYENGEVSETVNGVSYEDVIFATYEFDNAAVNGEYFLGTDAVVFADGALTAMGGEYTYNYNVTTGMITTNDEGIFFQVIDGVIYFKGAQPLHQHVEDSYVQEEQEDGSVNYICQFCGELIYVVNNAAVNGEYFLGTDAVVFADGALTAMGNEYTYTYNVTTGMINTNDEGIFFQVIDGVIYFKGAQPLHQHNDETISVETVDATCTAAGSNKTICQFCGVISEEPIEVLDHVDADEDYLCDNGCGTQMLPAADTHLTIEQALAIGALTTTEQKYYVTATINEIVNDYYGNVYITDGTNTIYVYGLLSSDGSTKYGDMEDKPVVGDQITIYSIVTSYNGTAQLENAYIESVVKHECQYSEATCETLATCSICGGTTGELAAHNYIDGKCDVCGLVEGMSITDTKYTFADYTAGTQYAENEEHMLDENVTVVTTQSHFTTQLRIYSSSTHNGYAIIKSANAITKIAVNAGNKVDVLVVYGSNDEGATWTEAAKISVTATTYGDYEAELAASYKWLKLDVEGTQQVRIASMTLTTMSCTHVHQTTTKTESTCTENGYEVVTCNACDAEISRVELALADHNYVGVVTEPTCTASGYTTYTCSACGASYEEAGEAALGHSYDANNMCERCGSEKHVCEYTSEVTKEPTCTEKGERTYTCTSCANSYTEEIEALGHTEAEIPAVAPTCTVAGATTGVKCSVCETVITAPETIEATGHSYTDGVCANGCGIDDPTYYFPMTITEALEQADGKNVKLVGTVISIDTPYSETYGNITVTIEDISGGTLMLYRLKGNYAVGDVITVSGTMDTYNGARQTAAGATAEAHVCSDFTEATCEVLATCKACGATTGELAEHTFGDDGVCSVCGQLNHVHDYTYNSVVTAPTCTEVGYTTNYCECGATEKVDEVAATGHNYTDGVCANGCGIDDPDYYYPMSIADALTAPVGKKVVLTGVISSVSPWSAQYGNMEAYLSDGNGNEILLYRIVTEVGVGDKVSVQGEIGVYNNANQIAQNGSTVTITEKHVCSEYTEATCQKLAACVVCGAETGDFAAHNYVNGVCSVCSHEEGTAEVVTITASKTVADLITEYGWTSSTTKQTFNLDDNVTVKINGGSNTGKAYSGNHIRIYATDSPAGTVTISVPEGYELVSIKISTITGTYAFLYVDGTTTDICNQTVDVSGSSVVLNSVKNGSDGKQVRITAIEVVYKEA